MSIEQAPIHGAPAEAKSQESLSADVAAILDSVDIPIIVVSRECLLTRFNRAALDVLSLAPADTGRPLSAIGALAELPDLEKLCAQVISDEMPLRRDIRVGDRRFLADPASVSPGASPFRRRINRFARRIPVLARPALAVGSPA